MLWRYIETRSFVGEQATRGSGFSMNAISTLQSAAFSDTVNVAHIDSPLGMVHVASVPAVVCLAVFDDHADTLEPRLRRIFGPFFRIEPGDPLGVERPLRDYFAGKTDALRDVPLATSATPMQRRVWALVSALRPGMVTTYAALAERIGIPRGQRAVGVCLASNPVPLFVPCHRVVSTSGGLASHPGGVARKRWLLRHEGALDVAHLTLARAKPPRRHAPLDPRDTVELIELVVG